MATLILNREKVILMEHETNSRAIHNHQQRHVFMENVPRLGFAGKYFHPFHNFGFGWGV
jgi:hypothetical protein